MITPLVIWLDDMFTYYLYREGNDEYLVVEQEIKKFARQNDIPISEVRLAGAEYPEEIEW